MRILRLDVKTPAGDYRKPFGWRKSLWNKTKVTNLGNFDLMLAFKEMCNGMLIAKVGDSESMWMLFKIIFFNIL